MHRNYGPWVKAPGGTDGAGEGLRGCVSPDPFTNKKRTVVSVQVKIRLTRRTRWEVETEGKVRWGGRGAGPVGDGHWSPSSLVLVPVAFGSAGGEKGGSGSVAGRGGGPPTPEGTGGGTGVTSGPDPPHEVPSFTVG